MVALPHRLGRRPGSLAGIAWAIGLPISIILITLGVVGDGIGFWTDKPFSTNLVTAFAGAGIGIPFTITVLNWFTRLQAELHERTSIRMRASRLLDSMQRNLNIVIPYKEGGDELVELERGLIELQEELARLNNAVKKYARSEDEEPRGSVEVRQHFQDEISATIEQASHLIELQSKLFTTRIDDVDFANERFKWAWRTLADEVRPRILEIWDEWPSVSTYRIIEEGSTGLMSASRMRYFLNMVRDGLSENEIDHVRGLNLDFYIVDGFESNVGALGEAVGDLCFLGEFLERAVTELIDLE